LLLEAFDSGWIAPLGPFVDRFERDVEGRIGRPAAALSSGTAALHLALLEAGVEPGDAVLVADLTFVASANAVRYAGADPVFVDVDRSTWTMDPQRTEDAIRALDAEGRRPRAMISVDLYGQTADYEALEALAERYEVTLIEDAAEALGATGVDDRPAGSFGRLSVLSFNGNKTITTSGGGMLLGVDRTSVDRARWRAAQAREPVAHYEHEQLGFNYRMSNLLAAVGVAQLEGLDAKVARRRDIFAGYAEALAPFDGIEMMPEGPAGRASRWLSCLTVDDAATKVTRDELIAALASANIEARPVWKPMHLQPLYRSARAFPGAGAAGSSVAADLFRRGLCLPSGSSMRPEDQARVVSVLRTQLGSAGA